MKNKKKSPIILYLLIAATLAFIWGNSLQNETTSAVISWSVLNIITPFLEIFVGTGKVTVFLVRKLAHFTEFAILGIELALLLILYKKITLQTISNCLFFALSTAVIDESIQIYSGRGPMVEDILLDFVGAISGFFLIAIVYLIFFRRRKKAPKKN